LKTFAYLFWVLGVALAGFTLFFAYSGKEEFLWYSAICFFLSCACLIFGTFWWQFKPQNSPPKENEDDKRIRL